MKAALATPGVLENQNQSPGGWADLFDFYFRVYAKLVKDLKIPFKLEGAIRVDDTPVHKAIREALANCLVNADFYIPRGVVIRKDVNTIVLENPGYIRTGSGVPDIYEVWDTQGWKEPSVEELYNPDRTSLLLAFVSKQAEKTSRKNKQKKQIEKDK